MTKNDMRRITDAIWTIQKYEPELIGEVVEEYQNYVNSQINSERVEDALWVLECLRSFLEQDCAERVLCDE